MVSNSFRPFPLAGTASSPPLVTSITALSLISPQAPSPRVWRSARFVAILGVLLGVIALVVAVLSDWRGRAAIPEPVRLTIPLPDATLATYAQPLPQISPDGRRVALIVASGSRIWLENLGEQKAQPIAGTENATGLFWAPDSQDLAFTTTVSLKT